MRLRNGLAIFAMGACFTLASLRLVDVYNEHVPLALEGACVGVMSPNSPRFGVLENDIEKGSSVLISSKNGRVISLSYKFMREMGMRKVPCK